MTLPLFKLLGGAPVSAVVWGASAGAALGGLLVAVAYREGPHPFRRAPFSWGLVAEVVRHRPTRLATYGYLGHMWELYAMWTWVPAFLAASAAARTTAMAAGVAGMDAGTVTTHSVDLAAFSAIAVGGIGCVWGGWMADRIGRAHFINLAMVVSGACSLAVGAFFGQSFWILLPLVLVWGLFVVADSAQFSAMVTEVAPQQGVGTALTLQTSVGFPTHDGDHPRRASASGVIWLGPGVSRPGARPDSRHRRDPKIRPGSPWPQRHLGSRFRGFRGPDLGQESVVVADVVVRVVRIRREDYQDCIFRVLVLRRPDHRRHV